MTSQTQRRRWEGDAVAPFGDEDTTAVVTMTSPDQNVRVRFSRGDDIEVRFRAGAYPRYREDRLAEQLTRLGSTGGVAFLRARSEAHRRVQGLSAAEVAAGDRDIRQDPRRRRFSEALGAVEGHGVSPGGAIRLHTTGLLRWHVDIAAGTIRSLGEERFLAELRSALRSLMSDRELRIVVLRAEMFDMGIPQRWLDAMRRLQAANARR